MIRSALVATSLYCAFAFSCLAAGADSKTPGEALVSEEQRVAALEDEWLQAEVEHDEATLRPVIDDRCTLSLSNGTTSGKEQ